MATLICLAGLGAAPLAAQEPPRWTTFAFQGENDAIALFSGSDEFYTTGTRFFGLRHPDLSPRWARSFSEWWRERFWPGTGEANTSVGFAFGQNFYTPDDISIPTLIPDDRPYAAWLYGALLLHIADAELRRQHVFELQLGTVGPHAGGEWVQRESHELIDDEPPLGWDHQIPNEPGLNLIYNYRRRWGGDHLDVVPHFGGALGTVMVMANGGATVRAGWNVSGFPQSEIPTTDVPAASRVRSKWEFYGFAGVDARLLAHNIFLDGTVFRDSHSVDKENFVYDLRAGFSFRYRSFRFHYTFVRRSPEFSPRRGEADGRHDFGSLTLGVERAF